LKLHVFVAHWIERRPPEDPVPIQRLNHAVLYVRDVDESVAFYTEALGFRVKVALPGAAFLQAEGSTTTTTWACSPSAAGQAPRRPGAAPSGSTTSRGRSTPSAELHRVATVLTERGALVGASDHGTTKALYARDPDGLEFEVSWLVPAELLTPDLTMRTSPLDLDAEIARYGADTLGGIGVSVPVPS
jgi:catechol-2,3-dioxygenase